MNKSSSNSFYFYGSLLTALWFLLTCWCWTYLANVFISFPFALLSFFLWRKGQQQDPKKARYKIISAILIAGVAGSFVSLIGFLIFN